MSITTDRAPSATAQELEFVAFYAGDILLGADIRHVEEIDRHVQPTVVPHAPRCVRGVVNLRGEVVTVIDLRTILGLPPAEVTERTRVVVIRSEGEQIGLFVDRIADVVLTRSNEIDPPPANVGGVDGRFFKGVHKLETELLLILDIEAVLSAGSGSNS